MWMKSTNVINAERPSRMARACVCVYVYIFYVVACVQLIENERI